MNDKLSRRSFLQSTAAVATVQAFGPQLRAYAHEPIRSAWMATNDGIHCFEHVDAEWFRTDFVECEMPTALALHAPTQTLYVAHGNETYERLPAGSVSCYRFAKDRSKKIQSLTLLHRQALSLACVQPDAVAVSPGGDMLVVASGETGILNVLPLDAHGIPSAVTAARKELAWSMFDEAEVQALLLRFSNATTLVASRSGRCLRYDCTLNEISLSGQGPKQFYPPNEMPASVMASLRNIAGNDRDSACVWL